jgi:hypothetical protein
MSPQGEVTLIKAKVSTKVRSETIDVKQFLANLAGAKESYVTIGLHEDAGQYTGGKSNPSVVEVGLWNEFGTETSPERSFLRSTIDENQSLINNWRDEAINNMILKGWTLNKALEMMGFRIQVLIQNKIKSNMPPPLAKSTSDAKISHGLAPVTLIETGLMLRSVTFKVELR